MLVELVLLLVALPAGFLVAYLARDELIQGRKWFIALIILSSVSGVALIGLWLVPEAITSFFVALFSVVGYWKSFDSKWTRRRI